MKELDIKEIWDQSEHGVPMDHSQELINKLLRQRPKSMVDKFVVMLKIELWFNALALTSLSIYFGFTVSWLWFASINTVNVAAFFYYRNLINKLNIDFIDNDVVKYLSEVERNINRFIRHYKVAIWIIVTPAIGLAMYIQDDTIFSLETFASTAFFIKWFVALVAAILFAYLILYFWYGKRANKIKEMVQSLENEENDSAH